MLAALLQLNARGSLPRALNVLGPVLIAIPTAPLLAWQKI